MPGTYTITMRFRGQEAKQTVRVLADPRQEVAMADRVAKWNAEMRAGALQESVTNAIAQIQKTRTDVNSISAKLRKPENEPGKPDPLIAAGRQLTKKLDDMEHRLWEPPHAKGIEPPTNIMSMLRGPMGGLMSSFDAPTEAQMAWLARAEAAYRALVPDYNKLFSEDVAKYREAVRKSSVELLPESKPLSF